MPKSKQKLKKPIETCAQGKVVDPYPFPPPKYSYSHLLDIAKNEHSFIHEHVMTLYFIASEFKCKRIVEIGTGMGESTLALAMAAYKNDGHVTTFDIENCFEAKQLIEKQGLIDYVTFIQCDKEHINYIKWDGRIDLVFIDGDHSEDAVRRDSYHYGLENVVEGGFMINHDTCNPAHPGVLAGLYTHYVHHGKKWVKYDWLNCNGLAVWRRNAVNRYDTSR